MVRQIVSELMESRRTTSLSQRALGLERGTSQSDISRLERLSRIDEVSFVHVSEVASLLGLELSAGLHPYGEPIRDKGHQALINRFRALLSQAFKVLAEVPLPLTGDPRAWDLVLRLAGQVIGVEVETRIRDIQRLVRHVHQRERDGGVGEIVLVLAASRTNRRLVDELRSALGARYSTSPRALLKALRDGESLPGSGVILL